MPWIRRIHLELNSTLKKRKIKGRNLAWKLFKSVTRDFIRTMIRAAREKRRRDAFAKRLNV